MSQAPDLETGITESGLSYVTVDSYRKWLSENMAIILTDDSANNSQLEDNDNIIISLLTGESTVDSKISSRYCTPVNISTSQKSGALIRIMVYTFATYALYGRRGITEQIQAQYNTYMKLLVSISDGSASLPDAECVSSKVTSGYTFSKNFLEMDIYICPKSIVYLIIKNL